jgi:deazaflavin-dependent oxidoreductase (nitroreductase family)
MLSEQMNSLLITAIVLGALVIFFTLPLTLPHNWYRALYYPGGRPNALSSRLNATQAWLTARGILPALMVTLETRGRRSGKPFQVPMVVAQIGAERYLVSMLGENSDWVRNVRAANGAAVLRHKIVESVVLEEVPVAERAPIMKAYLRRAPGARPHIDLSPGAPLSEFEKVAARYPVFRIAAQ